MKDFEDELDCIRIALYEETRNMTNAEIVEFFHQRGKEIAERYGFEIIPHAKYYGHKAESVEKASRR